MELQHVNVKLYLRDPQAVKLEALVPVFHGWIQNKACEELLIDVADYRHVHAGPGVVLIGHQADYSVDNTDNRLAFVTTVKQRLREAIETAFRRRCARPCWHARDWRQTRNSMALCVSTVKNMKLFVNDRMLAPNAERRDGFGASGVERFLY